MKRRLELFDQTISPTVLYGACTWTVQSRFKDVFRKRWMRDEEESPSDSTSSNTTDADEDRMEDRGDWIRRLTAEVEREREKSGIEC